MMDRILKLKRLFVAILLIATWRPAIAGMERTTPAPTELPTDSPTSSPTLAPHEGPPDTSPGDTSPVVAPSFAPVEETNHPTGRPTSAPTRKPSAVPTFMLPTLIPTQAATIITPSPSRKPTAKPSSTPSTSPSQSPSSVPSMLPTKAPVVTPSPTQVKSASPTSLVVVPLPLMSVTLAVQTGQTLNPAKLQSELTVFYSGVLSSSSFRESFEFIDLTANPFSDSAYLVRGKAYYQPHKYPTEKELEDILQSYFSFFGAQKLTEFLNAASMPVSDVKVEVGAEIISGLENQSPQPVSGEGGDVNVGLVAGAAVGSVVFLAIVVALAFAVKARHKKSLSLTTEAADGKRMVPEASPPNDGLLGKELPPFGSRVFGRRPSEIGSVSSDDLVSYAERSMLSVPVDGPIFVFDPMVDERSRSPPNDAVKYDISRLDHVISSAKDFTDDFGGRKR